MTVYVNGIKSNYLTPNVDIAQVEGTKKDTIYGAMTGDPNSTGNTLTPNDTIVGNGKTTLDLKISNWTQQAGATLNVPGVSVSGVRALDINLLSGGTTGDDIALNALNWGSSLERIALSGVGGTNNTVVDFAIDNLTVGRKLVASASGNGQHLDINAAKYGASIVEVDMTNKSTDATVAKAWVQSDAIVAVGGAGDTVTVSQTLAGDALSAVKLDRVTSQSADTATGSSVTANLNGVSSLGGVTVNTMTVAGNKATATLNAKAEAVGVASASVGAVNISNAVVNGTDAANLNSTVVVSATSLNADATVGDVTVGPVNVTQAGGASQFNLDIDATATNGLVGVATVGVVSVGNISAAAVTGNFKADIAVNVDGAGGATGDKNLIAGVSVGNATIASAGGDATLKVAANALTGGGGNNGGAIGNVNVGNVSLTTAGIGNDSSLILAATAAHALGNVTVGSLTVDAGTLLVGGAGGVTDFSLTAVGKSVGNVSVGNLTLNADGLVGAGGVGDLGVKVQSTVGAIGTVDVGNITLDGAVGSNWGNKDFNVTVDAASHVGASKIGNVAITAGGGATVALDVDVTSAGGNVDSLKIGAVSLAASGALASAGTATLNVDLAAAAKDGDLSFTSFNLTGSSALNMGAANVNVDVASGGGNINTGTITAGSTVLSAAQATWNVDFDTTGAGNIVIGNITVTGSATTDNLDLLTADATSNTTWLHAAVNSPTTGSVTVGNIDYSAYVGLAVIDVYGNGADAWKGASEIKGSLGGSTITGNVSQNTIVLESGLVNATDNVVFKGIQTNGVDPATADFIKNFNAGTQQAGDQVKMQVTNAQTAVAVVNNVDAASYQAFLASAATSLSTATNDAYAQKIDGVWYVAVDAIGGNTNAVDYVYKIDVKSGTTLDATDFAFI